MPAEPVNRNHPTMSNPPVHPYEGFPNMTSPVIMSPNVMSPNGQRTRQSDLVSDYLLVNRQLVNQIQPQTHYPSSYSTNQQFIHPYSNQPPSNHSSSGRPSFNSGHQPVNPWHSTPNHANQVGGNLLSPLGSLSLIWSVSFYLLFSVSRVFLLSYYQHF